ncbi:hypothetical protein DYH09_23645 [bacterium CPR1]|nr:hypothetical protein [bacterium CPR1]
MQELLDRVGQNIEHLDSIKRRPHDASMRTTVTLDPDVAEKLKGYAHREKLSFKQALNELIRRGLRAQQEPSRRTRFKVKPHHGGFRPGIDPGRLNQLLDELEVQDFSREARADR